MKKPSVVFFWVEAYMPLPNFPKMLKIIEEQIFINMKVSQQRTSEKVQDKRDLTFLKVQYTTWLRLNLLFPATSYDNCSISPSLAPDGLLC